MSKRNAYEVKLPRGPVVVIAELTCHELLLAMKAAGPERAAMARGFAVSREAIRMSVRRVDGVDVAHHDLVGKRWRDHFPRTRHTFQLAQAWSQIHVPELAVVDAVINSAAVEDDGHTERWTVTLPDGRAVTLAEGDPDTVEDVMRQASASTRSEAAAEFGTLLEGCRRSVRQVNGQAVTAEDLEGRGWDQLFSVSETIILGRVWMDLHAGGENEEVGKLKPVPGG